MKPDESPAEAEPASEEGGADGKPMTFWEHLDELRARLIRSVLALFAGCLVAWQFHGKILEFLEQPYFRAWQGAGLPGDVTLNAQAPAAPFFAYLKLSLIGGAALAAPVVFYQLWSFVAPGLYAKEKKYIIPFVSLSTLLFVGGGYFAWRGVIPISFRYFLSLSHESGLGHVVITPMYFVGEYIDFCLQVMLGFGLTFQLPMLLLFLSIAGVVNYLTLIKFGRWFILIAFIVAAVLTPPDVVSQLMMAIPMCLLYAVSIGLVYVFGKPPTEEQKAAYRAQKQKDKAGQA
jgi:sec-independent protein translocase protein TatC